jgi:indolepyruvate ferredoxin oxidoreductase, alpha subunit
MSANKLLDNRRNNEALLLGNEAIARGVLEAGVQVIAAYPGTPSSEIVDSLARVAREAGIYVEWSTNEKVAFELAAGAAFLGVRSFTAMKSVGLNVAMDALMVVNLTGVQGGFVFLVADDPNCWSTQNEQDSRLLAVAAEVPCLEPSSVQEAKDMIGYSFALSEKLGRAVMIRTVTRLNHSRSTVEFGAINTERRTPQYYSLRSGFPALPKHKILHAEKGRIIKELLDCPFNELSVVEGAKIGVVASGNAVNYAREAMSFLELSGKISFLKVGTIVPLPVREIREMVSRHEVIVVLEDIEPFIEKEIKTVCYDLGRQPKLIGKESGDIDIPGELTIEKAIAALSLASGRTLSRGCGRNIGKDLLLDRNTVLCAGCPHAAMLYSIRRASKRAEMKPLICGDIGCYGLGVFPPYSLFDSHICMGASIGIGNGYAAAGYKGPIVCVIGDSTFYHSGISPLVNAVFNRHNITVVILDNHIIGMTGHQPDPGTGLTAMGEKTKSLDLEALVRACGVEKVDVINAFDVKKAKKSIREAIAFNGPSVVISKGECAILSARKRESAKKKWFIESDRCDSCGVCVNTLFCPALRRGDHVYAIDISMCANCGVCADICPKSAIISQEVGH